MAREDRAHDPARKVGRDTFTPPKFNDALGQRQDVSYAYAVAKKDPPDPNKAPPYNNSKTPPTSDY